MQNIFLLFFEKDAKKNGRKLNSGRNRVSRSIEFMRVRNAKIIFFANSLKICKNWKEFE